jgi:hypothetical protein
MRAFLQRTSAYVIIRQHTSAYVNYTTRLLISCAAGSMRAFLQRTSAYVRNTSAYVSTSQLHSSSANFVRSNIHACFPAAPHNIYPRRNSLGHTQPQPPTHPHPHHTHTHTHTHTHPPTHPPLLYIYIYILKLLCMCASSYADGCSVLIR